MEAATQEGSMTRNKSASLARARVTGAVPSSAAQAELLATINKTLARYISESDPRIVFEGLLNALLTLTESEYGFIGEVLYSNQGRDVPSIVCHAMTNIAWNAETRRLHAQAARNGLVFAKLDSLYGAVLETAAPVIANQPATDERRGGLPRGHPALRAFLGLPLCVNGRLQGMVGIANRPGGYDAALVTYLEPFLQICGSLVLACRNNARREQAEQELHHYKQKIAELVRQLLREEPPRALSQTLKLSQGYAYHTEERTMYRGTRRVDLTQKERLLFHSLAADAGRLVERAQLEKHVWAETRVSESSLRALVLRLRKKLPGLEIQSAPGVGYLLVT
jgi:GAF domain-containing protein